MRAVHRARDSGKLWQGSGGMRKGKKENKEHLMRQDTTGVLELSPHGGKKAKVFTQQLHVVIGWGLLLWNGNFGASQIFMGTDGMGLSHQRKPWDEDLLLLWVGSHQLTEKDRGCSIFEPLLSFHLPWYHLLTLGTPIGHLLWLYIFIKTGLLRYILYT